MIPRKMVTILAGLSGISAVALGAMGAHSLRENIAQHAGQSIWQTAVEYHLAHAVALLTLAGWSAGNADRRSRYAAWISMLWMIGILFFSGSLYALALGAPPVVGPLTPIGGVFLLAGWVVVLVSGWQGRTQSPSTNN